MSAQSPAAMLEATSPSLVSEIVSETVDSGKEEEVELPLGRRGND